MSTIKIVSDGVSLNSVAHPVTVKLVECPFSAEEIEAAEPSLNPNSIERVRIEIDERFIPTLEERRASGKPLYLEDLCKIDGIVHTWLGKGWIALAYHNNVFWSVEKE